MVEEQAYQVSSPEAVIPASTGESEATPCYDSLMRNYRDAMLLVGQLESQLDNLTNQLQEAAIETSNLKTSLAIRE